MKFIRKNASIEAVQWTGKNIEEVKKVAGFAKETTIEGNSLLKIKIGNGLAAYITEGHFIVKENDVISSYNEDTFNTLFEKSKPTKTKSNAKV